MPNTYIGQTPTAANANLETLPQLATILGALPANVVAALQVFAVTPPVANAAARDALIPAPQVNQRVLRLDNGTIERFGAPATGANKWLVDGLTRAAGPIVASHAKGLVGDGVTDDGPFLAAADAAAVASGGRHELDLSLVPTKVLINSNLTLSAHFRPNNGAAKIAIAAGKTLNINGPFDPALYRCFDLSLGGIVNWGQISAFALEWFVVGDGAADDSQALNLIAQYLPNQCRVTSSTRMICKVKSTFVIPSRKGIDWTAAFSPFPDGTGTEIQWFGKSVNYQGFDANTTAGQPDLTTTTGRFTPDHVGQYVIVDFAGPAPNGLRAKILTYVSATHVVMDTNAGQTRANVRYTVGSPVVFVQSCDHVSLRGFTIRPATLSCYKGYDGYIAAGTNVLNAKNLTGFFVGNHNNKMIWIQGAGPGGTDFVTTITGINSSTQVTLAANASTTIANTALTNFLIGAAIDSLPALYAVLSDETGLNGSTGTVCHFEDLHIHSPVSYGYHAIAISLATLNNQEYHVIRNCDLFGGDGFRVVMSGITGEFTTNSTTNVVSPHSLFLQSDTGRRIRLANQGAAGGIYDGKIIAVANGGGSCTLAAATTGAAANVRGVLGEGLDIAVNIGPSPNAKRILIADCEITAFKWGIWEQNGSFHTYNNSYSNLEANIRRDDNSEPTICTMDNTENSLRHLDDQGTRAQITFKSCRYGNIWQQPNGGFFRLGATAAHQVILEGCQFDNTITELNSVIYEIDPACQAALILNEVQYANSPSNPTMAQLGFGSLPTNSNFVVTSRYARTIADPPDGADIWTIGATGRGGISISQFDQNTGSPIIHTKFTAPQGSGVIVKSGIRSQMECQNAPSGGSAFYPLEAMYGQQADNIGGTAWDNTLLALLHLVPPTTGTFYARNQPHHGTLVESPSVPTAGQINDWYAHRVKAIQNAVNSRVVRGYGFWQEGTGDRNQLAGDTLFGTGRTKGAVVGTIAIAGAGSAQPNPQGAEVYRYSCNGATATISAPLNPAEGRCFTLEILNNTAGALAVTLDPAFMGTFPGPGAGKWRTQKYVYDATLTKWKPEGNQSPDL